MPYGYSIYSRLTDLDQLDSSIVVYKRGNWYRAYKADYGLLDRVKADGDLKAFIQSLLDHAAEEGGGRIKIRDNIEIQISGTEEPLKITSSNIILESDPGAFTITLYYATTYGLKIGGDSVLENIVIRGLNLKVVLSYAHNLYAENVKNLIIEQCKIHQTFSGYYPIYLKNSKYVVVKNCFEISEDTDPTIYLDECSHSHVINSKGTANVSGSNNVVSGVSRLYLRGSSNTISNINGYANISGHSNAISNIVGSTLIISGNNNKVSGAIGADVSLSGSNNTVEGGSNVNVDIDGDYNVIDGININEAGKYIHVTGNHNTIANCNVVFTDYSGHKGISIENGNFNKVIGCTVAKCTVGIGIESSITGIYPTGNSVIGCTSIQNQYYGIYLYYARHSRVMGNACNENDWSGIAALYSLYNNIVGNSCLDSATYDGITIDYDSDYNIILGNLAQGNNRSGIEIHSANCDSNIVGSNILVANPLTDNGTGTVKFNNVVV